RSFRATAEEGDSASDVGSVRSVSMLGASHVVHAGAGAPPRSVHAEDAATSVASSTTASPRDDSPDTLASVLTTPIPDVPPFALCLPVSVLEAEPDAAAHAFAARASPLRAGSIDTVYYVPHALPPSVASVLMAAIDCAAYAHRWVQLKQRRLQMWGGMVRADGLHDVEALPPFAERIVDALMRAGVFPTELRPNHLLINEYLPGQGIMPHTDGPAYTPRVATLSLGSAALMRFSERDRSTRRLHAREELLLGAGSLVVFTDDAYTRMEHEIPADEFSQPGIVCPCVNSDAVAEPGLPRTRRISITVRHVRVAPPSPSTTHPPVLYV
ncbi:hypothetical protein EON68_01720, partial [archaeon]